MSADASSGQTPAAIDDTLHRLLRPHAGGFADLMPFRVREILLVSSAYDAFILEEDGPLTERLFAQYSELNMSWAPRITHAPNSQRAMQLLEERHFDLVLTTPRLADANFVDFAERVKKAHPTTPVVAFVFSEADLFQHPDWSTRGIDRVLLWTGDARALISLIKLVEDYRNVEHDTSTVGVQMIVVVEDTPRHYSSFLSLLYTELLTHSTSLIAEGLNPLHKLVRMRARPKILLATDYEQARDIIARYHGYVAAVITDVRIPRNGTLDSRAGLDLVRAIREELPDLPILIQSAELGVASEAAALAVPLVHKESPELLPRLRRFFLDELGFGPFVFRMPDGRQIAQARDVFEMEKVLATVPAESVGLHAKGNDFSRWLTARSMFRLADELRTMHFDDFENLEAARRWLGDALTREREAEQQGMLRELQRRAADAAGTLLRVETGSIGGKARGVAFIHQLLAVPEVQELFGGLQVRVPKSAFIGTDVFDRFVGEGAQDKLHERALAATDDQAIIKLFFGRSFWFFLKRDLGRVLENMSGPLAVRSSSLLEDHQFRPFSGIYATYMLPNSHPDAKVRAEELARAVKAVFASAYSQNARAYLRSTPYTVGDEKMGVLIQEVVGQRYGDRYYPTFSGVAMSHNFYPVAGQRPEDGIALVALGLGHQVVGGGAALRFSPGAPQSLPQHASAKAVVDSSQRRFYALNMARTRVDFLKDSKASLEHVELAQAEEDGTLAAVASVYSPEDDAIRDNLRLSGPRVVTFNDILKHESIPLAQALRELMRLCRAGMGCEVEIEFAVDMGDFGRPAAGAGARPPILWVTQVRPLASPDLQANVRIDDAPAERLLGRTDRALGHGLTRDVRDVVYVNLSDLDAAGTKRVAELVGKLNSELVAAGRPYLLVGPGRWGSSDPTLGIPVRWSQISGARVIVETRLRDRDIEPSQGTHFFQNVTSLGIGYLTISRTDRSGSDYIDLGWLDKKPAVAEADGLRHVRLDEPLEILIDGHRRQAVILEPRR